MRGEHTYHAEPVAQFPQDCPHFKIVLGTSSVPGKPGQLVTVIGGGVPYLKAGNGWWDAGREGPSRESLRGQEQDEVVTSSPDLLWCIWVGSSPTSEQDHGFHLCTWGPSGRPYSVQQTAAWSL